MDLQTILSWFKRGCKPTEAQFEATFRSFRHKDDAIPMGDVAGLAYTLANKSDKGHTHTLAEISDYDGGDKEVINAMVAEDIAELDAFAKTEGMYYILLSEHLLYQYLYDAETDTYALAETEPDGQVVYSAMDADENVHIYIYNVPQLTFQDVTNDQVDKTIYTNNLDSLITKQLPNGVYSVVYVNSGIDNNMYGDAYTLTVGDGSMFGRILECRSGWAQTVLLDEVYQWEWNHYSYRGHTHEISDVTGLQEKLDSITYGDTGGNTKSVVTYDSYGNFPTIGDSETLYIASDTNTMYAWSGTRYVQIGGNESNSVHFYNYDDIEQVDELPDIADATTDKLYMADGVIYKKRRRPAMGNKPSRFYFAVCSNEYVIEMPSTLYATNDDGVLGVSINAQENINYIDILSGDIYAWDDYATQFSLLTGQLVTTDDVLLVRYYSNEFNMTNEMSNVFASVKTAGEYAVIMYATTSGISESYTLLVKESTSNNNITQVCTNGDVRYSRTYANGKWGLWNKKENAYKSDIEELAAQKADVEHTHEIADVNGLTEELDDKAPANHTHEQYLTEHQDISGKQDKDNNTDLNTTSKSIVGAINEVWQKFNDYLKGIRHITYEQLVMLRDNNQLVAGQWYRITNYMTTIANDTEARSAEHPFDLLVMATNENTLSEEAKAVKSAKDTNGYFADANLTAWKVWYCLDNDTKRFQWADTETGKGVIYRMIDEWQNDCPYDFKNVQFKRYRVSDDSPHGELADLDSTYIGINAEMQGLSVVDEADFVWAYTFTLIDENADWVDYSIKKEGALNTETDWGYLKQFKIGRCEYNRIRRIYTAVTIDDACYRTLMLNNIVLISTMNEDSGLSGEMQMNDFGTGNYNMTVKDNPEKNTFGNKCYNNIVGSYGNTFGNDCGGNTFGNSVSWNTFGNNVYDNTFGNDCYYNTFGNYVYDNTFGNNVHDNTFGNYCWNNTFGNSVSWNTFGNNVYDNTFGNNFQYNTFGNYVRYLTVFDGVHYVAVTGGSSDSSYIQNAQILNGTMGSDTNNRLQISFQASANYCQFAGLNSSGILRIWTPADAY